MTVEEMRHHLIEDYAEQCERWPRLREVPEARYIAANLPHMRRMTYWKEKQP